MRWLGGWWFFLAGNERCPRLRGVVRWLTRCYWSWTRNNPVQRWGEMFESGLDSPLSDALRWLRVVRVAASAEEAILLGLLGELDLWDCDLVESRVLGAPWLGYAVCRVGYRSEVVALELVGGDLRCEPWWLSDFQIVSGRERVFGLGPVVPGELGVFIRGWLEGGHECGSGGGVGECVGE